MIYKNAYIFQGDKGFVKGGFSVEGDRFGEIFFGDTGLDGTDLKGTYVLPGLIDIHTHGNSGADFSDGDYDGLVKMGRYLASNGITSFVPANMTLPYEVIERSCRCAVRLRDEKPEGCARLAGVQMEGPFFSEKKKGAQNADYLRLPDFEAFKGIQDRCDNIIRIVDLAPELEGAVEFTQKAKDICTVSAAHTDSDYEHACDMFEAGARHVTHLYNGMPSIHHRKPSVIGAASEREDVVAELICDGLHVHPSAVRMAFKLFPGRICLVSDNLRCAGMPEGIYELGGQKMQLKDGEARLLDGTLAGSVTSLYDCMLKAISFGIDTETAVIAATATPANELGKYGELGSIEAGKYADFVVADEHLARMAVYIGGVKIG